MSAVYDNWERLVGAVLDREKLKQIALFDSFDTSISADLSSRVSFASSHEDVSEGLSGQSILSHRDVRPIEFKELKEATRNFRPGLTLDGGLGRVFKGWIDEHSLTASKPGIGIPVAVKILTRDLEGLEGCEEDDGLNELHYLSQLRHPNLIKLIGYCSKEANMLILVYEFMSKGSLDNLLFGSNFASGFNQSISWVARIKVAIGAARALSFLHDLEKPVIHRFFRTATILIDGEFNAKLSSFNLARDGPTGDMTHVTARVVAGEHGYAAPEYMATGHLTAKCDVYSFGVFLLELLSWHRVIDKNRLHEEKNLADWAKTCLRDKKKIFQIMDRRLEFLYGDNKVNTIATIALQCLSAEPKQRPRMAEVLVALEQLG